MLHTLDHGIFCDWSAAFENQLFDTLARIHDIMTGEVGAWASIDLGKGCGKVQKKSAEAHTHGAVLKIATQRWFS